MRRTSKKKALATPPRSCRATPRSPEPIAPAVSRPYPNILEALRVPDLRRAVRAAVRAAACAGVVVATGGSAGCADPVCASDSYEELTAHAGTGLDLAADFEMGGALEQLAIGTGVSTHPLPPAGPYPLGGVVAMPDPGVPGPLLEDDPDAPPPDDADDGSDPGEGNALDPGAP